ncbi:hypothetical protein [Brevundimonas lenta]|uniref:Uncharacterized protein n=1 Tax=Brevundimonas lenta TaxID=424796 RepID=A0A7W6JB40_9CAUL|nr:hypothetical protein [Brevundimonas lenta]MBB4081851.1 hypothetical protein [Brevundimonas lenta]
MFRAAAVGGVLAVCLFASPAAAEPFENFVKLCINTKVDGATSAALAKADGWVPLPPETLGEEPMFEDPRIFLSQDPAGFTDKPPTELDLLMTGWGSGEDVFGLGGVKLDFCAIAPVIGEKGDFIAQLGAFLAIEPMQVQEHTAWVFSPQGAGFISRPDLLDDDSEAEFLRVVREEKVFLATVVESDGTEMLLIGAIRPAD